ncbi:MAG: O-methyltransferase [Acidimicrobiaceae bacterium]
MTERAAADRYLDLLSACLTRELFLDQEVRDVDLDAWPGGRDSVLPVLRSNGWRIVRPCGDTAVRAEGRDWPPAAETMVGGARLANVRWCAETALREGVAGDFVECGVWRGGVVALLRGVLAAHGVTDRTVWGADSFEGLPVPDVARFPEDQGYDWSHVDALKVSLEDVEANLARYGLLDAQVRLLPGWFEDTLPSAPIEQLAVLRIDGDLYQSTMDALVALEPRVSPGGFVIIDDYHGWIPCRQAVDDYRSAHGIAAEMTTVDWTAIWWRKPGTRSATSTYGSG